MKLYPVNCVPTTARHTITIDGKYYHVKIDLAELVLKAARRAHVNSTGKAKLVSGLIEARRMK